MGWEEGSRMWVPAATETRACGRCCLAGLCPWEAGSHPDLEPGSCLLSQGLDAITTGGRLGPASHLPASHLSPGLCGLRSICSPIHSASGHGLGKGLSTACFSPTLVSDQPQK